MDLHQGPGGPGGPPGPQGPHPKRDFFHNKWKKVPKIKFFSFFWPECSGGRPKWTKIAKNCEKIAKISKKICKFPKICKFLFWWPKWALETDKNPKIKKSGRVAALPVHFLPPAHFYYLLTLSTSDTMQHDDQHVHLTHSMVQPVCITSTVQWSGSTLWGRWWCGAVPSTAQQVKSIGSIISRGSII